ncbi:MAG: glycosyltransferase family 4 protein [Ferruginibacter sp.]
MPKLMRITTVPLALRYLLQGQMLFMKNNGFDVLMVSADGQGREAVMKNEDCPHVIVPMTRSITPIADLKCLWQLIKLIKKEKPDIIHTHTPKAGLLGMMAAKYCGVKIRIHTIAGLRFVTSTGPTKRILISMEKITCAAANHVWPNSNSMLRSVKEYKLSKPSKLEVIAHGSSNGIDLERFSPEKLTGQALQLVKDQLKYDPQLRYLLFVGRIVKDKGVEELLEAFDGLYKNDSALRLVLVGSFENKLDPISEKAATLLHEHPGIIHIPWSDLVEYFMSLAYLLVHPSHREGFPNVLLQAGAMNCPIVCSQIDGNIDVVVHEQTGLLFKTGDPQDLQKKLSEAIAQPEKMKEQAIILNGIIHNNFDQKIVHRKILERYRELMAENVAK